MDSPCYQLKINTHLQISLTQSVIAYNFLLIINQFNSLRIDCFFTGSQNTFCFLRESADPPRRIRSCEAYFHRSLRACRLPSLSSPILNNPLLESSYIAPPCCRSLLIVRKYSNANICQLFNDPRLVLECF